MVMRKRRNIEQEGREVAWGREWLRFGESVQESFTCAAFLHLGPQRLQLPWL